MDWSTMRAFAAGLVVLVAGTASRAATVPAEDARIREVTVYRDRAEVVREARVTVAVGASTLEFSGIPFGVEADSLRVSAQGVPAVLGAVEIVEQVDEPEETPEYVAARDEVRRLERQIADNAAAAKVDTDLAAFLQSLRATTAESASKDLGQGRADTQGLTAFYDLLSSKLTALAKSGLDGADRRLELHERIDLAQARLVTLRPPSNIRSRVARVEVEARQSGALTLRLAYVIPGARWSPSYRATLDATTGNVNLVAEGVVRQSTGEDWTDVTLNLSSAAPAQGVEPPFLTPWTLLIIEEAEGGYARTDELEAKERFSQNVMTPAPGVADAPEEDSSTAQARLIKSAYNVAFTVPGTSDVPTDGRDHRVVLRTETLRGRLVHRTMPGLTPRAYLTSVTTSPADYPLLSGPMRVFAEGAYLGSFGLEEKGPGAELTIPFGIDNRIDVVRVPLPKSAGRQGLGGKQREVEFGFRTQLHNRVDRAVTLVLEDRVPISEDERVDVELDEATTPGYEDSPRRPGVMIWTFDLAPDEKREIVFAYRVRYPKDLLLPEID